MQWTRSQLLKAPSGSVTFDEDVTIEPAAFAGNSRINGVKDVHVSGKGFLDPETERFHADLNVTGIMLCPDAITSEEVEVPFETDSHEVYAFAQTAEEDVRVVTNEVIELLPAVIQNILLEVPLQVIKEGHGEYPHGNGWRVLSEAEYQESRKDHTDPRLAKLKEFQAKKQ